MKYKVEFSEQGKKDFKKLDTSIQRLILKWIKKNLVDSENPRVHGKALAGNLKGYWRYRVGNYRILCDTDDEKITILVLEIGHRSEIYK
jgi:mRNA interferase RelE/StbE